MTSVLRSSIQQMAAEFASSVLSALRGASLEQILAETAGRPGHLPARSARPAKAAAPAAAAQTPAPKRSARAKRGRPGRLPRRSVSAIAAVVDRIVALLATKPKGLRAEQIRDTLHLQSKELPRPIADALKARRIHKVGEKRATTYFASAGRPAAAAKSAPAKKAKPAKANRPAKPTGVAKPAASPKKSSGKKRGGRPGRGKSSRKR
jgi:hypothetical protein